ncbi:hypothetical protein AN5174.2 [Aspergillus nidulans FGSC A4]|nr:hypothetical protein AN5174.2 [Aspergillus nidulans FGSC A4]|eukprot:XP_662778.1 hypothetical protein AN5174.2 [Aspergillus nidulans FGSC A4]
MQVNLHKPTDILVIGRGIQSDSVPEPSLTARKCRTTYFPSMLTALRLEGGQGLALQTGPRALYTVDVKSASVDRRMATHLFYYAISSQLALHAAYPGQAQITLARHASDHGTSPQLVGNAVVCRPPSLPLSCTASLSSTQGASRLIQLQISYPRISYLPSLLPRLKAFFSSSLIDPTASQPHDGWFSFEGVPLKWHYPVGLLYDLYAGAEPATKSSETEALDDEQLPWRLVVHFGDWPDAELVRLDAQGTVMHDAFINSVKEADFVRNGTAKGIMTLSKDDSSGLWKAVQDAHNEHSPSAKPTPAAPQPPGPALSPSSTETGLELGLSFSQGRAIAHPPNNIYNPVTAATTNGAVNSFVVGSFRIITGRSATATADANNWHCAPLHTPEFIPQSPDACHCETGAAWSAGADVRACGGGGQGGGLWGWLGLYRDSDDGVIRFRFIGSRLSELFSLSRLYCRGARIDKRSTPISGDRCLPYSVD